jgi:hypothetical protein
MKALYHILLNLASNCSREKLKEHDGPKNVELHKQCPVALQTPLPLQVSDDVQTET